MELYGENLIPDIKWDDIFRKTEQNSVSGGTYVNPTIIGGTSIGASFKSSDTGARLEIFPVYDPTIGQVVYNAAGIETFKILVDGTDTGDVILGNYDGGAGAKWDNSASTFSIKGALEASSIHIPDEDTTANSFHAESDGDTFWGCTQSDFTSDNDNALAYILSTGIAKFQQVTIAGASSTIAGRDIAGFNTVVDDGATPAVPTNLSATEGIQYVLLEWDKNSETDMSHYEVYRYTTDTRASAVKIADVKTTMFVDGGLAGDTAQYYWIKAVDHIGNTSDFNASPGVTATPRNVENADVTAGIAAEKVLIDGAVYLSNWRKTGDVTKIDGGNISASSITLTAAASDFALTSISGDSDDISEGASNYFAGESGADVTANNTSSDTSAVNGLASTTLIVGGFIGTNLVVATSINVTNLAAVNADMGAITAGTITLDSSGYIRGGQTAYDTGTGFFLGYSTSTYKFSITGTSGDYFKFDGVTIEYSGGKYIEVSASDNLKASADTETVHDSTGPEKRKEIKVGLDGEVRVKFDLKTGNATYYTVGRVYVNGVAAAAAQTTNSTTYVTKSDDIDVVAGDLVQLYIYGEQNGHGNIYYAENFRVYYDKTFYGDTTVNQDD